MFTRRIYVFNCSKYTSKNWNWKTTTMTTKHLHPKHLHRTFSPLSYTPGPHKWNCYECCAATSSASPRRSCSGPSSLSRRWSWGSSPKCSGGRCSQGWARSRCASPAGFRWTIAANCWLCNFLHFFSFFDQKARTQHRGTPYFTLFLFLILKKTKKIIKC